jgi:trimethylamine--corrinoid protein Co-methyltransferase
MMSIAKSGGLNGGQYKPLTESNLKKIHESALDILENIGLTYESGLDDTFKMLENSGARIERGSARIFLPRKLVEQQISFAPERVILFSKDGRNDIDMSGDRVYMGTGGLGISVVDLESGIARQSLLVDIYNIARLVDSLDNIHFFLRPCTAFDVPVEAHDINCMYAGFKGTSKHYMSGASSEDSLIKMIELAEIVAGGKDSFKKRPIYSLISCFAISPLKLCTQSTINMQEACRRNIPVALSAAPMAGSTSPVTMAGTLVQLHAEQLAGLTICQLTQPGSPQLYGGIPGAADMRTMGYVGGAVECGIMNAAIHQLAAFVKVPNYNSSGLTDSKIPDAQAGWEKAFTSVLAAMGGSNFVHHAAGMLESMKSVAYEQYVIDDEIIGMCSKVLRGIEVDDEHLALDAIKEVGPGGNYLMSKHTLKHMRSEFFTGNGITDRKSWGKWEKEGSLDARARAKVIVKKILDNSKQPLIHDDLDKMIRNRFDIRL